MMLAVLALSGALFEVSPVSPHFDVAASYEARRDGGGEVAVRFTAKDPDVKINEAPAPRLKLEEGPAALAPAAAPPPPRRSRPPAGPGSTSTSRCR